MSARASTGGGVPLMYRSCLKFFGDTLEKAHKAFAGVVTLMKMQSLNRFQASVTFIVR